MKLHWQWKTFVALTDPAVLYQLLRLRQQVFIIEQGCIYPDLDDQDQAALHLLGWADHRLAAYARLFLPHPATDILSFGRVVVDPAFRGFGLGEALMEQMLAYLKSSAYRQHSITISAQCYLTRFYEKFGFKVMGDPYLEDGIPHVKMVKDQSV